MTNINLLGLEIIICLFSIVLLYKILKIDGLYMFSIISFIISNIMSLKTISLFNYDINLGIIPLISVFISTNIIVQQKGKEEIKKIILIIISSAIISYGVLYLNSVLNSSNINLFTNKSYDNIFLNSPRIYFASIVTLLYTLLISTHLYYYLKILKNKIIVSNLFSSIISQFIAAILFPVLAYAFVKEPLDIIKLIIIRYIISLIVSVLGTIPIYITNKLK